jgi:hypothetical protein
MRTSSRLALVVLSLIGSAFAGSACSSSSPADAQPAGLGDAAPDVTPGSPVDGGDGGVTAPDAATTKSELPACLGTSIPIVITTGPHASLAVGAAPSPYVASFLIDYATTGSIIDLSTFAAPGPTATQCNPQLLGQLCTFADLDFFGPWGAVTLRTSSATILGTDFLAHGIYTLDYTNQRMLHVASKGAACADAALEAAGLAALSTAGFFASDLSLLKAQHDIDTSAPLGLQVANVPVVPIKVAGTAAIAQLDTGFDDKVVPHSINMNVAFLDAINAASPGALLRDPAMDLTLSTCAGVSEPAEAYHFAAGTTFELVDAGGAVARSWSTATVFVKRTPAAAFKCGGIGTWSSAAAQIGTSFFTDMGALVFDPYASRVWVGR